MAMVMLFSVCVTTVSAVIADDHQEKLKENLKLDGKIEYDYVSLGASNTNGYGHLGYLPPAVSEDPLAASKADMNVYGYGMAPENSYPVKIQNALQNVFGSDVTVNLNQLAISSMRVEEVLFLLDESYEGDAYLDWRFYDLEEYPRTPEQGGWFNIAEPGGLEVLRKAYADYIANAELITFDLGWNNFGVFAFNNIKAILANEEYESGYWNAPALDQLDMDEKLRYQELKTIAFNYLKSNLALTDEGLLEKLDKMADVLAYAALGACSNFDAVMEKIYALNPDVQVVVLNIQNLADDLVVDFMGQELKLGDLYGKMISLVDDYRRGVSPYADKYMFANTGDIETFLDEIVAWDGDPTTLTRDMKDCFDMYDNNLYVRSIVEYMMVGQAFSGLFAGFRDMAAGYGLEVFKNDSAYTYEFALTRTPEQLLSLDLAKLDLNNPAGADKDVEEYGKALKDHLYNLRHFNDDADPNTEGVQLGKDAYNYVFENLLATLTAQRDGILAQLEGVPEAYWPPEATEGLAQLNAAIEQILPAAKAEFATKLQAVYDTYHNTLNYAYDVVATFIQYAAKINTIEVNADSLNGFNAASKNLLAVIFNDFVNGSLNKFYYELEKNGVQATGAPEVPEYVLDESIFDDAALRAIAVLAVRYELGSSFFAHPNVKGNEQVKNAVLFALAKGTTAKQDAESDLEETWEWIQGYIKEKHPEAFGVLVKLAKYLKSEEFELLCEQLEKLYNKLDAATTPEQKQKLAAQTYQLLSRLQAIAAMATADKVEDIDHYVSIGDSTLSGYGLPRYIIGNFNGEEQVLGDEAPVLLAQKLFGDDWAEHFTKLDKGGLRTNDILVWLGDESYKDAYYDRYTLDENAKYKDTAYYQNLYQSSIKKADLITLTLGGGDVSTYIEKQLLALKATYDDPNAEGPYKMDWAKYFPEADMTEIYGHIETITQLLDGVFGDEKIMDCEPEDAIPLVAEAFLYGFIGYINNHSKVVDLIHEINPDAHIVIVSYFNTVDGMKLPLTIEGLEIEIPVGDLLGMLVETSNASSLAYALENEFSGNDYTTYVSINDATTILDEQGIFDYKSQLHGLIAETWQTHAGIEGHKYIADQIYTSVTTEYGREELVVEILKAFGEYYEFIEDEFGQQILDSLTKLLKDAYNMAYEEALRSGVIDRIEAYIDALEKDIADAEAWLDFYREYAYAKSEELIAKIEKAINDTKATIEEIHALLNDASKLAAESWNELLERAIALDANVREIAKLLGSVIMDLDDCLDLKVEELKAEAEQLIATLNAQAETKIAELKAEAKKQAEILKAEVEAKIAELEAEAKKQIEMLRAEAEAKIPELKAEAEKQIEALIAEANDRIAAIKAPSEEQLAVLNEKLKSAVGQDREDILAEIARIEAELDAKIAQVKAELDAKISEINVALAAQIAEINVALEAKIAKINAALEAKVAEMEAELDAKLAEINAALAAEIAEMKAELDANIAKINAALAEKIADTKAEIKAKIAEMKAALEAEIVEINAVIAAKIAELKAEAEKQIEKLDAKAQATIAALMAEAETRLEVLNEQLKSAVGEAREAILAEMARIEAELDAKIAEIEAELDAKITEINVALEAKIAEINAALEAAIADCKAACENAQAAIQAFIEEFKTDTDGAIKGMIEDIDSIIASANRYLEENLPDAYLYLLDVIADQMHAAGEYAYSWLINNPEVILNFLSQYSDELKELLVVHGGRLAEAIKPFVEDALAGEYTVSEDSYYLAIGSDPVYAALLAEKLGIDFTVNGWDNISVEDLVKADLITLGHNENELSEFAREQSVGFIADYLDEDLRASLNEYVAKTIAHLFSEVLVSPNQETVNEVVAKINGKLNGTLDSVLDEYFGDATVATMDWAAFVGEENVSYVDKARAELRAHMIDMGVPEVFCYDIPVLDLIYENIDAFGEYREYIEYFEKEQVYELFGEYATYTLQIPVADALAFAGESYAYGLAQFAQHYNKTICTINALNPDATVVVLGHYNAFEGLSFNGVDIGGVYADFAKAVSAHAFAYALAFDNVTYVDIADAQTVLEAYANGANISFESVLMAYLMDPTVTSVSEAGHAYICDQILNALTLTCAHVWEDATCTDAKTCKLCGETEGEAAGHRWNEATCTSPMTCTVCGSTIGAPVPHTPEEDDGDCTTPVKCSVCGTVLTEAHATHTPEADDGDCTTAVKCSVCGMVTTEAHAAHTPEADDGDCTTAIKCGVCGTVTTEAHAAHTPEADDGDCTTAIKCSVCGTVTTAAHAAHTPEADDGDCTTAVKCSVCGKVTTEANAAHTPEADDGDCTTAVKCSVCGKVTTAANAAHTYGDWTVTKEATATEAGERKHTCSVCGHAETEVIPALGTATEENTQPADPTTPDEESKGLSGGAIAAISVGSVVVAGIGGFAIFWFAIKKKTWADLLLIFKK